MFSKTPERNITNHNSTTRIMLLTMGGRAKSKAGESYIFKAII